MSGTSFVKYLKQQALLHPAMTPQDAVKLCFQAAFGAEHILMDLDKAWAYLWKEFEQTLPQSMQVFEPVCDEYCRCNLAAWKRLNLPLEWLFQMFYHSALRKREHAGVIFMEYLDIITACANSANLPFSSKAWHAYMDGYITDGIRPVHHSEIYRATEHPAYRIVKSEFVTLLPVLQALVALSDNEKPKVIAIDGRAAAGKSTAATLLSQVLDAGVIYMDDFFLPMELRTEERLVQSGGNIHYERFQLEVLPYLKKNESFSYRRFDCGTMDYGEPRFIQSGMWRIVEGSYSCHPAFGDYMDCRVFCDISPDEQMNRIVKRDGVEYAQVFASQWIPMEEQYFQTEQIRSKSDIVIRHTKPESALL
ncbi:MAG: hypothetical protein GX115_15355 [Ruminiclostridium sp.]|nr:hypothetical protein [Ruminiclostridium sp.]